LLIHSCNSRYVRGQDNEYPYIAVGGEEQKLLLIYSFPGICFHENSEKGSYTCGGKSYKTSVPFSKII